MNKIDLIKQIEAGELVLSHSSFNEFCKSPQHFVAYKLREKKTTDAMLFGSMVHCLVLEPDEFESRYAIAPECDRRTKAGKELWQDFTCQIPDGVEVVKNADWLDAQRIADNIKFNPSSSWLFDQIGETEVGIEWEYKKLKWRGFIDGIGRDAGIVCDLKILADAHPNKVERYIRYEGAGRQAVHYLRGAKCENADYYIVAADRSGGVSVTKIGRGVLETMRRDIDWYIAKFKHCVFKGAWNESYDFFAGGGIYEMNSL